MGGTFPEHTAERLTLCYGTLAALRRTVDFGAGFRHGNRRGAAGSYTNHSQTGDSGCRFLYWPQGAQAYPTQEAG